MVNKPPLDDFIDGILEDSLPGDMYFGPNRCAICGKRRSGEDALEPVVPLHLPLETRKLMANPETVSVSDDDVALRLHFCEEHWADLLDIIGEPQVVSFAEFDARFIETASAPIQEKLSDDSTPAESRWDQDTLRVLRDWMENLSEHSFADDRQRVEGTLVVSAVDNFGIDYGPTERAKDRLVSDLRSLDFRATQLKDPWLDVEIQHSEVDESLVGTVFVVSADDCRPPENLFSRWRSGPERAVSKTAYCPIRDLKFTDYVAEARPDARYIGFYWLEKEERWAWYPFPEDYNTSHQGQDRQLLPVNGPTDQMPSLPLEMMSSTTLSPEEFETELQNRWETIESERPLIERARDKLRRKLNQ